MPFTVSHGSPLTATELRLPHRAEGRAAGVLRLSRRLRALSGAKTRAAEGRVPAWDRLRWAGGFVAGVQTA